MAHIVDGAGGEVGPEKAQRHQVTTEAVLVAVDLFQL